MGPNPRGRGGQTRPSRAGHGGSSRSRSRGRGGASTVRPAPPSEVPLSDLDPFDSLLQEIGRMIPTESNLELPDPPTIPKHENMVRVKTAKPAKRASFRKGTIFAFTQAPPAGPVEEMTAPVLQGGKFYTWCQGKAPKRTVHYGTTDRVTSGEKDRKQTGEPMTKWPKRKRYRPRGLQKSLDRRTEGVLVFHHKGMTGLHCPLTIFLEKWLNVENTNGELTPTHNAEAIGQLKQIVAQEDDSPARSSPFSGSAGRMQALGVTHPTFQGVGFL